jgi:hypothetical protein
MTTELRTEIITVTIRGVERRIKLLEYGTGRALRVLARLTAILGPALGGAGEAAVPAIGSLAPTEVKAFVDGQRDLSSEQLMTIIPALRLAKLGESLGSSASRLLTESGGEPLNFVAELTDGAAYAEKPGGGWRSLTVGELEAVFGTDLAALGALLIALMQFEFGGIFSRTPTSGNAPTAAAELPAD